MDRPVFYAPDFFLDNDQPWLSFGNFSIQDAFDLSVSPQNLNFSEPSREPFLWRANGLLEAIARKELNKAVPVEFAVAPGESFEIPISRLPESNQVFPYGFWTESEGMLGATPEILFQMNGYHLQTMALAGTAATTAPSLFENPKEMHEHRLVIEDIEKNLRPLGRVEIFETSEKVLPNLKHLFTPIRVELRERVSPETLVQILHPTAALGGFPREIAKTWLRKQPEASIRRRFGAPFGFVDGDAAMFVVAIRNIQRFDKKIWLGSGCGIVEGSVPENEWQELKLKRQSVRDMLGIV